MSSRSNRSKQLKQMEDAVLGVGLGKTTHFGGGIGSGDGGRSGESTPSGGAPKKKANVDALADLERQVKLSIGGGVQSEGTGSGGTKSGSSRGRRASSEDLSKSLAEGLAHSRDSSSVGSTTRYADPTVGGADPLDAKDLDEGFGSGSGGGATSRAGGGYRVGSCASALMRNKKLVAMVVVLVAVAVGVSVGVVRAKLSSSSSPPLVIAAAMRDQFISSSAGPVPTEEENMPGAKEVAGEDETAPSAGLPPGTTRLDTIKIRLLELGVIDPALLEGPTNPETDDPHPQYQAMLWIANDDPMSIDPSDPYLPHRFALASLWYATYDDAARYDEANPPSQGDETFANWDRKDDWLSEKGICLWYGVRCLPNDEREDRFDGNHQVVSLNLTSNNVRGRIPEEIWTILTDMRHLDLSDNLIAGTLSPEVGRMVHMEDLKLGINEIEGTIPTEIGNMAQLKTLYLEWNWMEGLVPTELGLLANLKHLGLYKNWFNGTIPYELANLKNIQSLYLDINELTGEIPPYLFSDLPALNDLRLGQNVLTGLIPDIPPGGPTALKLLYLEHNELTGDIPESLATLTHLEELHLYKNALTGTLPPSFGRLSNLDRLFLDHNQLTGTIPEEWAALDDLEELYLYGNQLTGKLPGSVLAGMIDLRQLKVGDNSFFGPIPTEMASMYKLEQVWLEVNVFSGTVPDLGDLHKLESLQIHYNDLTGTISLGTCDLLQYYALEELTADCAADVEGVPAKVECKCCTSCPVPEVEIAV